MRGTANGHIERRATIRDIAKLAGVSVATVSRVVNNRPDVAPSTREAVLRQVRAQQFTTHRGARGLSVGRTGYLAFTMAPVHASFFASILAGAVEAASEQDMRVALCATPAQPERNAPLLDRLDDGTTDGAIVLHPTESNEELTALRAQRYPFVVADPRLTLPLGIPAVSSAHRAGAMAAIEHLLALGHRRIAHISGPRGWSATEERIEGLQTALASAGVLADPELVVEADFESSAAVRAASKLLDLPERPTAIFAANDVMAFAALRAVGERGLVVPGDVSVIGFDDAPLASMVTPALTTVRQPLAEVGRTAVSMLMRLIEGQRIEALRIELATQLIVRGSTGPVPVNPALPR